MSGTALHGVAAELRDVDALRAAVEAVKGAGYRDIDIHSPFPLPDMARDLGWRARALPWIAAAAGALGAAIQYGAQYWMGAVAYPLDVGGRPIHSWPALLPSPLVVAILWAGAATLLAMLLILRLPRLEHPAFAIPGFGRVSQDRFFLVILTSDPLFEVEAAEATLRALAAERVSRVAR